MKKDISFIKNKKPDKCKLNTDNYGCKVIIHYPSLQFFVDFNGLVGILLHEFFGIKPINVFHNHHCFDNIVNVDCCMNLFHFPKQNDQITESNKLSLQFIYKRFFGI